MTITVLLPVQRVTIVKLNGSLGMSIIGGAGQTSHPFGVSEPGIFVSKVRMCVCLELIVMTSVASLE